MTSIPVPDSASVRASGPATLSWTAILMFVGLAAVCRLILIALDPAVAGDSETYKNVADNVLRGCGLSMSPAGGPECVPHQGGQNLPGLPLFIAFTWLLFGRSDLAILLTQLSLYLASVAWLLYVVARFEYGRRIAITLGLLLAISPLTLAWARFVAVTEVISLAASMWVLAELLLSIQTGRLQACRLGLAFAASVFVRAENALYILPIALTILFAPHQRRRALAVLLVTVSVPFGTFALRNIAVGLPPVSPPGIFTEGLSPSGYFSWLDTWMTTEYQRADAIMATGTRTYSRILLQPSPFVAVVERERAMALLQRLNAYEGQPFPRDIDAQFAELAREERRAQGVRERVEIYVRRMASLWLNPYSGYGLPIESNNREHRAALLRTLEEPGAGKYLTMVRDYPAEVLGRGLIVAYKGIVLLGSVAGLFLLRAAHPLVRRAVAIAVVAVASRTAALVVLADPPQIEARYVVSVVPWLEAIFAFSLATAMGRWRAPMQRPVNLVAGGA